ncbi:MAG: HEAT repeat domain-containing protein, partial [Armatimonadota bacterium]|nr:HEAT repeat domain-containing protein [Armatimonadota bacterium]
MAEVAQAEATGSNRRVQAVVGIVVLIVAYLVVKSVIKKNYIKGLASPDPAVRTRSAQWLMDNKILTDILSRQSVPVKRPMIKTLEAMNTDAAAGELIALMKDRNPTVQNEAQFALQRMAPTSLPKLVDGLKNPDMNVKNRSALALIAIGKRILQPVKKTVKDADGNETEVEVVPIVEATADAASRAGVIRVLTAVNEGAVPWLMRKMADEKSDAATKACCIEILGRIRAQEAAASIRAMLNAPTVDAAVRKAALVALGRLRHPDAFGLLKAALEDPKSDSSMKNTAIVGFGELRDPRAVPLVRDYLFGYDEALRDAAVAAFSKIGPPAIPALAELMKNPRFEVRMGALRSLAGIQDPRVVPILAAALKDPDENVRVTAAEVLGRPGDATAVPPLLGALSDPSWRVAAKARDSLAVVGAVAVPGLVTALGKGEASLASFYAQGALERIGEAAVPALMNA